MTPEEEADTTMHARPHCPVCGCDLHDDGTCPEACAQPAPEPQPQPLILRFTLIDPSRPGDVRSIVVTPTYKVRTFNDGTARGRTDREWILYRSDVPALTDAEWYATPLGDWTREEVQPVRTDDVRTSTDDSTSTGTQEKEP